MSSRRSGISLHPGAIAQKLAKEPPEDAGWTYPAKTQLRPRKGQGNEFPEISSPCEPCFTFNLADLPILHRCARTYV